MEGAGIATVFRTEAEFVTRFREFLPTYLRDRAVSWQISHEVGAGRSIADVVALLSTSAAANHPANLVLSVSESVILSVLRIYGPTRIDLLEQRCGARRGQFREGALTRLLRWEFVGRGDGGRISLVPEPSPPVVLAVEAKLTRWRDALRQAIAYRLYADESFVALPFQHARMALRSADKFREAGIGLFILDGEAINLAIPAATSVDHDWRREFVVSRLRATSDVGRRA